MLAWIVLGLVAGFIASKIVNSRGEGIVRDILLGIVGSVIGGWLYDFFHLSRVFGVVKASGFNLMNLLIAIVGAVIFLLVYHALFRRRLTSWR
jgi:uncharacterized membrane protein YeaQ/YmgE (transglycosylase-associated protein family)